MIEATRLSLGANPDDIEHSVFSPPEPVLSAGDRHLTHVFISPYISGLTCNRAPRSAGIGLMTGHTTN